MKTKRNITKEEAVLVHRGVEAEMRKFKKRKVNGITLEELKKKYRI